MVNTKNEYINSIQETGQLFDQKLPFLPVLAHDFVNVIREEIIGDALIEEGKRHGRQLLDPSQRVKALKKKYNSISSFLEINFNQLERNNIAEAKVRAEAIAVELEELSYELEGKTASSRLTQYQEELENAHTQYLKYQQTFNDDYFLETYLEQIKKKYGSEDKYISELIEEEQKIRHVIQSFLDQIIKLLSDFGPNNELNEENSTNSTTNPNNEINENVEKVNSKLIKRQEIIQKIENQVEELELKRKEKLQEIKSSTDKLLDSIKRESPLIPHRWQIILLKIFFFIIIFAEVNLIRAYTSYSIDINSGVLFDKITFYLFCFGYPLALGMIFKFWIESSNDRKRLKRILIRSTFVIMVVSVVSISLINSDVLVKGNLNSVSFEFITSLSDELRILLYAIFFIGLTYILSSIGGILFLYVWEIRNQYDRVRGALWGKKRSEDPETQLAKYKLRIEEIENKIKQLFEEKGRKSEELAKVQAIAAVNYSDIAYKDMVNQLGEAAINRYLSGYNEGRSLVRDDLDELDLLAINRKKCILKNNDYEDD